MQLVRNLYTVARERLDGYKRKIREAKLAEELEEQHSKEWVLDKYLNTVPYGTVGGQTAIGAGAPRGCTSTSALEELTLREAAMLAGMPQAPSQYSPLRNPGGAKARRNEVLGKMAELGMITQATAPDDDAPGASGCTSTLLHAAAASATCFDYVKAELIKEYGAETVAPAA